jgi:hypothetical protein
MTIQPWFGFGPARALSALGVVALLTLLVGCAGARRGEVGEPPAVPRFDVCPDSLFHFKGFGDLALAYEGERHRVKIDVVSEAGTAFESSLFGPFGGLIAWLSAGPDSATIEAGGQVRRIARSDSLAAGIPLLRGYPFTFNDFARIVSGRLYEPGIMHREPDSVAHLRGRSCYYWRLNGGGGVGVEVGGWRWRVQEVRYESCDGSRLSHRRFRSDVATEVHFELDPMNYFTLTYDKAWLGREGSSTRIE